MHTVAVEVREVVEIGRETAADPLLRRLDGKPLSLGPQPGEPTIPKIPHHRVAHHRREVIRICQRWNGQQLIVKDEHARRSITIRRVLVGEPLKRSVGIKRHAPRRQRGWPLLDGKVESVQDPAVVPAAIDPPLVCVIPDAVGCHRTPDTGNVRDVRTHPPPVLRPADVRQVPPVAEAVQKAIVEWVHKFVKRIQRVMKRLGGHPLRLDIPEPAGIGDARPADRILAQRKYRLCGMEWPPHRIQWPMEEIDDLPTPVLVPVPIPLIPPDVLFVVQRPPRARTQRP